MNKNLYGYVILGIILLLIIIGVRDIFDPPTIVQKVQYKTIRDTITKIKYDTLVLKYPVVKTRYHHKIDTIILTQAFEKSIDTTLMDSSRLQISYFFPGDTFKIKLQTAVREIIQKDSITTFLPIKVDCPTDYTIPILSGSAGIVGGIIIGILISK